MKALSFLQALKAKQQSQPPRSAVDSSSNPTPGPREAGGAPLARPAVADSAASSPSSSASSLPPPSAPPLPLHQSSTAPPASTQPSHPSPPCHSASPATTPAVVSLSSFSPEASAGSKAAPLDRKSAKLIVDSSALGTPHHQRLALQQPRHTCACLTVGGCGLWAAVWLCRWVGVCALCSALFDHSAVLRDEAQHLSAALEVSRGAAVDRVEEPQPSLPPLTAAALTAAPLRLCLAVLHAVCALRVHAMCGESRVEADGSWRGTCPLPELRCRSAPSSTHLTLSGASAVQRSGVKC